MTEGGQPVNGIEERRKPPLVSGLHGTKASSRETVFLQIALGTLLATLLGQKIFLPETQGGLSWSLVSVALGLALPSCRSHRVTPSVLLMAASTGVLSGEAIVGAAWMPALTITLKLCIDIYVGLLLFGVPVSTSLATRHPLFSFRLPLLLALVATQQTSAPLRIMLSAPLHWRPALPISLLMLAATALLLQAIVRDRRWTVQAAAHRAAEDGVLRDSTQASDPPAGKNELTSAFMSNSPFASYIRDEDGSLLLYNKHLADLAESSGVTEEVWLGLKDHERVKAGRGAFAQNREPHVVGAQLPQQTHDTSPGPNGTPLFWKNLTFPYFDVARRRFLVAGVSFDMTEDVLREAALEDLLREKAKLASELEASQKLFRIYADRNPNSCFIKTEEGRYVFYNKAFAQQFGLTETEWIGKSSFEVLPPSARELAKAELCELLERNEDSQSIEESVSPDGQVRTFKIMRYLYDDLGGARMIGGINVDITHEVQAEKALRKSHNEKELLLREIHHRVKNNLAVMSSILYLQGEKAQNSALSVVLQESQDRLRSMALVHEALYRSEDLSTIDFGAYAGMLAERIFSSHYAQSRSVTLLKDLDSIGLPIDRAVPCGLILNELLVNALKHAFPSGRQGSVSLAIKKGDGQTAEISVSDDGIGGSIEPNPASMGMRLVQALTEQVNGILTIQSTHPGIRATVKVEVE